MRRFGITRPLIVDTFSLEQGALFLLRRMGVLMPETIFEHAPADERDPALQITQEVDGLPLALDQVGAYIEATGISLASYRQIYQQHRTALLSERRGLENDHPEPVTTTWSLSMQRVADKSPAAADLLRFCAFLAPDAIGEEILTKGTAELGPNLFPVAADPYRLNQALEVLRAYSLVTRDPQMRTIQMHRLVQIIVRDALPAADRVQWVLRVVRALASVFPFGTFESWITCERLLPHALRCTQWIAEEGIQAPEAATLLHLTGHYLSERGRYRGVEVLHQRGLNIREQLYGGEHLDLADSFAHLGYFYESQGQYAQAQPLYEQALAIRQCVLGNEHPATAESFNDLAFLYEIQNNLAFLYTRQCQYAQAQSLYEQVLTIRQRVLGNEHPATAESFNDLAFLYESQGRYEQAQSLYEQALAIRQRVLGQEHPSTAESLNNLAGLYESQGWYEQAQSFYEQALAICQLYWVRSILPPRKASII